MARPNPAMTSVTLTTAGTVYNLYTLLIAVDADWPRLTSDVLIQNDPTAGSTVVYIGNSNVSSTTYGAALAASASWSTQPQANNLIDLRAINMTASANTAPVHVMTVTR